MFYKKPSWHSGNLDGKSKGSGVRRPYYVVVRKTPTGKKSDNLIVKQINKRFEM
jgi:hypothetical protein